MTSTSAPAADFKLRRKLHVSATLTFDTAWRIGSGKEGETLSDLGIVLDPSGQPVLPGSSLKGRLRSTCETLAHAMNLTACLLDHEASGVACTSDVRYYRKARESYRQASTESLAKRLKWIDDHTCDVCRLFGSPIMAGRIRVSDGKLKDWAEVVQVRDGVVIDRDSQTAVDGLKYDYEVVPPGSRFTVCIELDNPKDQELALVGAALFEWHSGGTIGGFTSRGLGRFHLESTALRGIDLDDPKQRVRFLTNTKPDERLVAIENWEAYFTNFIQHQITAPANSAVSTSDSNSAA